MRLACLLRINSCRPYVRQAKRSTMAPPLEEQSLDAREFGVIAVIARTIRPSLPSALIKRSVIWRKASTRIELWASPSPCAGEPDFPSFGMPGAFQSGMPRASIIRAPKIQTEDLYSYRSLHHIDPVYLLPYSHTSPGHNQLSDFCHARRLLGH